MIQDCIENSIARLRLVALVEGISFILLVFVAMPLKYIAGKPEMVSVVGMAHGILFLLVCLALFFAKMEHSWRISFAALVFVSALLPFGPFFMDRELKRRQIQQG